MDREEMIKHPVFVLGRYYMYSSQYFKANQCFEALLENGVELNVANYLKDLRSLCRKGFPVICNVLGSAYQEGTYLPKNERKAKKWFKEAKEHL